MMYPYSSVFLCLVLLHADDGILLWSLEGVDHDQFGDPFMSSSKAKDLTSLLYSDPLIILQKAR